MQEYAVRRGAAAGPGDAHHRGRADGLRIRVTQCYSSRRGENAMIDSGEVLTALPTWAIAFAFGYLAGAIPFGLIITRLAGTQDIREIGSRNLAAATLICDALKGTAAVLTALRFGGPDAALAAALGAFLGHLFPVWLKFKGGKGVATFIGLLLGFEVWLALASFCVI